MIRKLFSAFIILIALGMLAAPLFIPLDGMALFILYTPIPFLVLISVVVFRAGVKQALRSSYEGSPDYLKLK